jgi:MFS family permease
MGFSVLRTLGSIPGIVMPFVTAFIVNTFGGINTNGIRPLFYIQFVFLVPISLWVYRSLEEPERSRSDTTQGFFSDVRKFIVKGQLVWLLVGVFDSFGMLAFPFLMVYAVEVKGATTSTIALMGVASTITTMIFTIPFGRLADRIGRKPVLYMGLIPTFTWLFTLIYCPSPEWLILAAVLEGSFTATFPLWGTITMELVPSHWRGSYSGINSTVRGISSIVASLLGGILWETVGPSSIFVVALAFETSAIIVAMGIPETLKKV